MPERHRFFNALTGSHQHVGNYPGVTVEKKTGRIERRDISIDVVDLPGTYSLTAYSPEEKVVREYLIHERPDVLIDVIDASNLERNLYLALQFRELGVPMVIALNMVDLAEKRGLTIDEKRLSEVLGVPVVSTVARSSKGLDALLQEAISVAQARPSWNPITISYGPDIDQALSETKENFTGLNGHHNRVGARWLALKFLEGDAEAARMLKDFPDASAKAVSIRNQMERHLLRAHDAQPESVIAEYRYGFIGSVCKEILIRRHGMRLEISDRIDQVLTHGLIGPLFMAAVLYGMYQFVFWASEMPVGWLETFFGWLGGTAENIISEGLLRSLIVSGVIDGVGGVLGFVPLIMFMFLAIAVLEDTGYMARVAYLLDRVLRTFGLHGNSVVALIVGGGISGGCAVPGVMATRTLNDPQARLATILTVPFMNCGAKLPVYALLIAAFFSDRQADMMFMLTAVSWILALLTARVLRWTILKGDPAPFVMELPPYRLPSLKGLLIHMWERTWLYIKKAGTVILAVSVVIWAAMTFPGLPADQVAQWDQRIEAAAGDELRQGIEAEKAEAELAHSVAGRIGRALGILTAPLGFDWRTNVALVGGFAAKEVIVSNAWERPIPWVKWTRSKPTPSVTI